MSEIFPWASLLLIFFLDLCLTFSSSSCLLIPLSQTRWRLSPLARKARAAILKMPPLTKKRPALMNPPTKKPPRLRVQELARGPAIVLMTRRAQERKALHRPPTPPPLMQRRAPRSPSLAPT